MPAATYSFKGTADFSAHNKEVEGARKEIKKYEDEVKSAQKESNKLANPNFSKAYSSQKQLQNTVKNTTNIMNGLSGNMMGAISKFGPYAAAAVAAFKVVEAAINKARSVNEDFNDQIGKLSAQLKGSFDDLANRISRMDFTNLLSGLATAAKYAGQLYDSMDRAGTFKMVSNPAIGEAQNEITALRIQIQQLQVKQKELKKQGKDYSDIEAQVAALNAQIDVQLKKLKAIYEQQRRNAYRAAADVAAYMGVNRENISGLYNNRGVNPQLMNVALAAMNGMSNYIQAQNNTPGGLLSMLDVGKLVNFIANDIGSPLINSIQDDFKKLLAAWDAGNTVLANEMSRKLFGIDAHQMNDTLDAISKWVRESHSRFTEDAGGNLTTYTNNLNDANAARAAYLSAQQQHVGDQSAQVRVQWVPTGGSGGGKTTPDYKVGSIAEIDAQIKELKDKLANETFDLNAQIDINKQIEELENKKAMLDLQVAIGGNTNLAEAFGPLLDGMLNAEDVDAFCSELVSMIDSILSDLPDLQLPPVVFPSEEMEASAKEAMVNIEAIIDEEYSKICKEIQDRNQEVADSFEALGSMYSSIGEIIGGDTGNMVKAFGEIVSTVGTVIAKLVALASANGVASAFELPYPANLAALATVLAGVASAVSTITSFASSSFASGGIFEGTGSRIGDMHLARVNPGEMILNSRQQGNLFRILNDSAPSMSGNINGDVQFRISGGDLVGVLRNYDTINKRIR